MFYDFTSLKLFFSSGYKQVSSLTRDWGGGGGGGVREYLCSGWVFFFRQIIVTAKSSKKIFYFFSNENNRNENQFSFYNNTNAVFRITHFYDILQ